jgi:uncharacterized membrane protein
MTPFSTLGRLFFAISMMAFGLQQLITANFVRLVPPLPAWMPWHPFWACLSGVLLIAAGVAIALIARGAGILIPKTARLAATMSGIMIFLWVVLLHVPRALAGYDAGEIAGVFEALALSGVAFMLRGLAP